MKILIVDDDYTNLLLHRKVVSLLRKDAEIFTATDGIIGLEIFRKEMDIDLIVTDENMPTMNGSDMMHFIRILRNDVKNICISSEINGRILDAFDRVLQKPVDITQLRLLINDYLT